MNLERLLLIVIGNILVTNFVLVRFLGLCPFIGVSKRTRDAFGMGMAVTFVMTLASFFTYLLYVGILKPNAWLLRFDIFASVRSEGLDRVLRTVSYILVIAALVQLVEMFLRKIVPVLFEALGIYLPLITTNCAILGVALLNTTDAPEALTLLEAVLQGFCAGVGFTVVMLLMSGIRERLELASVPEALKGIPIAFISTGLLALAFLGFAGMV